ncbi:MAG: hypothetical protein ACRC62_00010 [Microcoleus sp.]
MKRISQDNCQKSQNRVQKQPSPLILALLITGILACEMYPALIDTAAANAGALKDSIGHLESSQPSKAQQSSSGLVLEKVSYAGLGSKNLTAGSDNLVQGTRQNPANQLPAAVAAAVRQDVSRQTGIAPGKLKVTESSSQSWPNSCLGLAKADEICGQVIVEGWRVVVSDGRQSWVYRTNAKGTVLRLEPKKK